MLVIISKLRIVAMFLTVPMSYRKVLYRLLLHTTLISESHRWWNESNAGSQKRSLLWRLVPSRLWLRRHSAFCDLRVRYECNDISGALAATIIKILRRFTFIRSVPNFQETLLPASIFRRLPTSHLYQERIDVSVYPAASITYPADGAARFSKLSAYF